MAPLAPSAGMWGGGLPWSCSWFAPRSCARACTGTAYWPKATMTPGVACIRSWCSACSSAVITANALMPRGSQLRHNMTRLVNSSRGAHQPIVHVMERQQYQDDDLLTKVQLAAALNVSSRTVDRWLAEGEGPPYIRLPRNRLRWRWGDVRTWLDQRRES